MSEQSATLTAGLMPEASEISLGPVGTLRPLARWASDLKNWYTIYKTSGNIWPIEKYHIPFESLHSFPLFGIINFIPSPIHLHLQIYNIGALIINSSLGIYGIKTYKT